MICFASASAESGVIPLHTYVYSYIPSILIDVDIKVGHVYTGAAHHDCLCLGLSGERRQLGVTLRDRRRAVDGVTHLVHLSEQGAH